MRNNLLEKSYIKCGGETFPRSFSKNENWAYFWINSRKFFAVCFNCMPISEKLLNDIKLNCRPPAFASYRTFLKNKKRSRTFLPSSFSALVLNKNIYLVIFYYLMKFHSLVTFTSWDIGKYSYYNCLLRRLWRHKF